MRRATGLSAIALVTIALWGAPAASAEWSPGPARYDVGIDHSLPVKMADGTILRADVYYPVDRESGKRAKGRFPVVMNMTPYGKLSLAFIGQAGIAGGDAGLSRTMPELVERGYINVIVDIRGTGRSQGTFGLLDPQQGRDGAEVVRWAAGLPHSNGRVGLYGPSYMALIQYFTAANLPRHSPLKAMFPVVNGNSPYRELAVAGGMLAGEADIPLFGVFIGLPLTMPLLDDGLSDIPDTLKALARNAPSLTDNLVPLGLGMLTDGDVAYDQRYWKRRAPGKLLTRVTRRRIPTMMVGGWRDVFQRGSLMNFAGQQNAWSGRHSGKPMRPRQRVTGRYQVIQGDWTHVTAGSGIALGEIAQRWFDTWLKHKRHTGVRHVRRPAHLYDMTRKRWVDVKRYPFSEAKGRTWYLGKGSLSRRAPTAGAGSDTIAFTGVSSPCTGSTDQYALGAFTLALESAGLENPCVSDDRTLGLGPGAQTYTSAPFDRARTLAGPIGARIYAASNRPEVSLIATLEDVSPSGSSRYLTSGALLGSQRKVNRKRSWYARGARAGGPVLPHHPYKRRSARPVPTGKVVRYDIEVFPVLATVKPGHRLRLTLTSVDTPHITPTPAQLSGLLGGVYSVKRDAAHASRLVIPTTRPGRFKHPCRFCR